MRQASGFMGSLGRQVAAMNVEGGVGSESGVFSLVGAAATTQGNTFSNADAASAVKTEPGSTSTSSKAAAAAGGSEFHSSFTSTTSKQHDSRAKPKKIALRKGKWTDEEELFTKKLIDYFNQGLLNVANGTTLRTYLSEKLWWYVNTSSPLPI